MKLWRINSRLGSSCSSGKLEKSQSVANLEKYLEKALGHSPKDSPDRYNGLPDGDEQSQGEENSHA